jgi:hypothetical protein
LFLKNVAIYFYPNVNAYVIAESIAVSIVTGPDAPATLTQEVPLNISTCPIVVLNLVIPSTAYDGFSNEVPEGITTPLVPSILK